KADAENPERVCRELCGLFLIFETRRSTGAGQVRFRASSPIYEPCQFRLESASRLQKHPPPSPAIPAAIDARILVESHAQPQGRALPIYPKPRDVPAQCRPPHANAPRIPPANDAAECRAGSAPRDRDHPLVLHESHGPARKRTRV